MEVEYLLFHEEKHKVEKLLSTLQVNGIFLFRGYHRWQTGYIFGGDAQYTSWDASARRVQRLGDNVIGYDVTIQNCDEYPELVGAILIELGWLVKVRYRQVGGAWCYLKCQFPAGCAYAHPGGWSG